MLRNAHEFPNDIIIQIEEDLYDSPNGRIVLLQESTKNLKFTQGRTFQSYINEFWGMVGLSSSMLKFVIDTNKRVPDLRQKVRSSWVLIVKHSSSFNKLPNKSLKPAFKQLLNDGKLLILHFWLIINLGTFSDVVIHVGNEQIAAHKCILCAHSHIFKNIVSANLNTQISSQPYVCNLDHPQQPCKGEQK